MDYSLSYGFTIIAFFITLLAQIYVNSSYSKYRKVKNARGLTGKEAARIMLDRNGLNHVKVRAISGKLSDHYDPRSKKVNLSNDIYNGISIASISVACHECGHAIQDKDNYVFMRFRASLVPIVNLSSKIGYFAILIGIIFSALDLIWIGIFAELAILLFQVITLPVEFNASRRALKEISAIGFLANNEISGSKKMLRAAALTYVASVMATLLEVFRLLLIVFNRGRD